ncbi:CBS domain-containing protein [Paenibacillus filicis]|uniref:CBS domain-containing protein n=1 Tax=Paenibacillus gyeongsangnamensis TaxID=3388067 RepID=A0ABT4QDV8_9BACL|nr:CBS domain-containing protein [Paenibacillus filicis]MCZ8515052.1 CBS domain-containing protein [Paenibacillus filicis]
MAVIQTFYLSRILGNKIWSDPQHVVGKLLDLIVDLTAVRPQVVAVKVKVGNKIRIVDFSSFTISKVNKQYYIECTDLKEKDISPEHTLFLVKHVLDKQIVDMFGRKVVRVNDLRLAILSNGVYTVAVDVGFEGLLRRLGIAKPLKNVLKPLGVNIPSNLLLWDDVETIDFSHRGIKLSKSYTKLSALHSSDLADIIEDLDRSTQLAVFSSLDAEKAADVLEELETEAQVNVIESLTTEKAANMLEKLPTDEVADILDEMDEDHANEILDQMEREISEEVRELMEYPDKSVGSLMTTELISFNENITVNEAIQELRRLKPDSESIYYIYIVNDEGKLIAHLSLRDLIIAEPETQLQEILDRNVIYVSDDEQIDTLNEIISKYNLLAVPVVDDKMFLVGIVPINDVVYNLLKSRRKRA